MRFLIFFVFIFYINPSYSATDDWTSYGKGSGGGHFSKADEIRDELLSQGIVLDDTAGGTVWKKA